MKNVKVAFEILDEDARPVQTNPFAFNIRCQNGFDPLGTIGCRWT